MSPSTLEVLLGSTGLEDRDQVCTVTISALHMVNYWVEAPEDVFLA